MSQKEGKNTHTHICIPQSLTNKCYLFKETSEECSEFGYFVKT